MTIKPGTLAWTALVLSVLLIISSLLNWYQAYAYLTVVFIAVYTAFGAQKEGNLGPVTIPLLLISGVVLLGFIGVFSLWTPGVAPARLVGGFAPATAILVYVIWLVPAFLGLTYALLFDTFVLPREQLERIRSLRKGV